VPTPRDIVWARRLLAHFTLGLTVCNPESDASDAGGQPAQPSGYRVTLRIRNRTTPYDHHRALYIGLLQGLRELRFFMSDFKEGGSKGGHTGVPH
jgi:hypothetical protein